MTQKITPYLWFDTQGLDAAEFYVSLFPNSRIVSKSHYGDAGPRPAGMVMTVEFELDGHTYVALNGGPEFTLSEAFSLAVSCADQAEVDHYWSRLLEGGGEASQCGWLKDRFGVSWQITPVGLYDALSDPDPERAQRAMAAMLTMGKIDLAAIQEAVER
jgi:predicted 3-demethylubiquinone-9 3-methyltransferase (glyoxalase superfamily)